MHLRKPLWMVGSALLRILVVILVGMPASLLFTAAVAKTIRQLTNTELEPTQPSKASAPFTRGHHIAWSALLRLSLRLHLSAQDNLSLSSITVHPRQLVAVALTEEKLCSYTCITTQAIYIAAEDRHCFSSCFAIAGAVAVFSLAAAAFGPSQWATKLVIPFMLAATVEGLLIGSAIPKAIAKFVHPLITCGLIANFGAALYAAAIGWPYKEALRLYLTKVRSVGAALTRKK